MESEGSVKQNTGCNEQKLNIRRLHVGNLALDKEAQKSFGHAGVNSVWPSRRSRVLPREICLYVEKKKISNLCCKAQLNKQKSAEVIVAEKKKKREGLNLLTTRSRLKCSINTEQ